jgi:hypothetical protein
VGKVPGWSFWRVVDVMILVDEGLMRFGPDWNEISFVREPGDHNASYETTETTNLSLLLVVVYINTFVKNCKMRKTRIAVTQSCAF